MKHLKITIVIWVVLILSLLSFKAYALDVETGIHKGEEVIFVSGEYYEYDSEVFLDIVKANPNIKTIVLTSSDGGLTSESYPISRYIRDNGLNTIVISGAECVSSCGIVWMGGVDRSIEPDGAVWLHLPYFPADTMWDYLLFDEYCETEDTCRYWTDVEKLQIYLIQNLNAVKDFYDFMLEMGLEPEHIKGTMGTNPWSFHQITG